jgi:hypothetical protein
MNFEPYFSGLGGKPMFWCGCEKRMVRLHEAFWFAWSCLVDQTFRPHVVMAPSGWNLNSDRIINGKIMDIIAGWNPSKERRLRYTNRGSPGDRPESLERREGVNARMERKGIVHRKQSVPDGSSRNSNFFDKFF